MSAALQINVPAEFDAYSKAIALEASKATAAKMIEKFGLDAEAVQRFLGDNIELSKKKETKKKETKKKEPKKKETKKDKSDSDEEKPKKKRGANGYITYSNELRVVVTEALQADCVKKGTKFAQNLVVSELAKRWKALDDDEQKVWKENAKEAQATKDIKDVVVVSESDDSSDSE